MRIYEILLEYINYDKDKFMNKWSNEGKPFKDEIGSTGDKLTDWLEQYDPSVSHKYVNWMIIRYLKNDIKRLEDIPARISPALKKYVGLQNKKKLKPEHKDINKIKNIEDVIDEYKEETIDSRRDMAKSVEQAMYDNGDAKLIYNDSSYKVVIPVTYKASCFFGKNTRWCTTTNNDATFHNMYSKDGPLYIILHKPTNTRWQFHFESIQYMDEKDKEIDIVTFFKDNTILFSIFKKLGYVDYTKGSWKIGYGYYNDNGKLHREDGPAEIYPDGTQIWYLNGRLHREDGPAVIHPDGTQFWHLNGKRHRKDGPAEIYPDGTKIWFLNGKRHREDGPAVISPDGSQEWWLNDIVITDKVNAWAKNQNIDLNNMSDSDKIKLKNMMRKL